MSNLDIFTPIIRELEEIARKHPDPEVRANIYHMIDVLVGSEQDQEMLSIMHQFYHLREQLREEEELRKLRESEPEVPAAKLIPEPIQIGLDELVIEPLGEEMFFRMFADTDEEEYDELVQAQTQWGMPIGEA